MFDEIHTQPNRQLYDVLTKGSSDARQNPLHFIITTAGTDRHSIAYELHTKAIDILEGKRVDPTFYPVVYGLKDDEDWEDEANWYKVNPSLGYTVVPFGQGYSSMSAPTKEFYKILMEGNMVHGGHPVLRWMAGNVVIDTDPAGNIKVTKARSKEKIDGIVAAIMALDRCIRNQVQKQGSVYDERGILFV